MKRSLAVLLVLAMALAALAGCGKKEDDSQDVAGDVTTEAQAGNEETTGAEGEDDSLQYILDKGEFILGLDDAFPPMGFSNDDQEIVGFDIDVAAKVCEKLGVELVLQPVSWDAKEQELATKNIDCIWNGLTVNEDRLNNMNMSKSYMKNTQVAVVLADSEIQTLADLAGKTVVVQNGSTAVDAVEADPEFNDSLGDLVLVSDNVKAMMDLEIKGSDCVIMDEVVARYYMNLEANQGKFRILDEKLADEEYAIAFRKGDDALTDKVNEIIDGLKADGTISEIAETWFGSDETLMK